MSIRKDLDVDFKFPEPQELKLRLKDVLEPTVDEKYYLNEEQTKRLRMTTFHSGKEENRVQDSEGECRTLLARDYKDAKCVRVGGLYDSDKAKHQAGSVYDPEGISATLSTMQGGNQEPIIMAQRGRSDGDWHNSEHYQKLEPREDGLTNTLSSVAKDNYVAEPNGGGA